MDQQHFNLFKILLKCLLKKKKAANSSVLLSVQQNKSNISRTSTKYNCDSQVYPLNGVRFMGILFMFVNDGLRSIYIFLFVYL